MVPPKKTVAPSKRHKNSRSLQKLHGVNAVDAAEVQMLLTPGVGGTQCMPGDNSHPMSALAPTPPNGSNPSGT